MALRDVNSLDYLCAGKAVGCPKPSLPDAVLQQIEQREKKGTYTHILAFHELSTTAAIMPRLITDLKARGYRFVTLTEYMKLVEAKRLKRQAAGDDDMKPTKLRFGTVETCAKNNAGATPSPHLTGSTNNLYIIGR